MASGDRDSARSAAGAVEISCRPADTTSGADFSAHARAAGLTAAPWPTPGGKVNGAMAAASAEASA
ncbi:MAG: hypothetical protein ACXVYI_02075 [Mycobacterium sp.]